MKGHTSTLVLLHPTHCIFLTRQFKEQGSQQAGQHPPCFRLLQDQGSACGCRAGGSEAELPSQGSSSQRLGHRLVIKASLLAGQGERWGGSHSKVMVSGTCIIWQGVI